MEDVVPPAPYSHLTAPRLLHGVIVICVSLGKVCPANASLGMRVSPHIYH